MSNHRQDTWSDLQLFAVVNLAVILGFGWVKTHLVDASDMISQEDLDNKPFWLSIYEVALFTFPSPANDQIQLQGLPSSQDGCSLTYQWNALARRCFATF